MTIRAATPDDSDAIAKLLGELGYPTSASLIPARLEALEREGGRVFVAMDSQDRPVGLAAVAKHAALHSESPVAYITALVTSSDARGQGIGRSLVEEAERWARGNGCNRLSVTSAEHRADAHAFYPSCGLPYTGRRFTKTLDAKG